MKKKMIALIITVFVIASCLVGCNVWNKSDSDGLRITQNSEVIATVRAENILDDVNCYTDTFLQARNGGMPALERNLTVLPLEQLLANANIEIIDVTAISATALDGFSVSYTIDEEVYIAVQEDGASLSAENGDFCMVVPQDDNSKRWLRQVCEISIGA